jgi:hypothetical protein
LQAIKETIEREKKEIKSSTGAEEESYSKFCYFLADRVLIAATAAAAKKFCLVLLLTVFICEVNEIIVN